MLIDFPHEPEICPHLGRRCPAAMRLAESFAHAIGAARAVVRPGFSVEATMRLDGCRRGCAVRAEATATGIRIICGSGAGIERCALH